jgi:hypothetical protein
MENYELKIAWVSGTWFNGPVFWPMTVPSENTPDNQAGRVSISVCIRMNSQKRNEYVSGKGDKIP